MTYSAEDLLAETILDWGFDPAFRFSGDGVARGEWQHQGGFLQVCSEGLLQLYPRTMTAVATPENDTLKELL